MARPKDEYIKLKMSAKSSRSEVTKLATGSVTKANIDHPQAEEMIFFGEISRSYVHPTGNIQIYYVQLLSPNNKQPISGFPLVEAVVIDDTIAQLADGTRVMVKLSDQDGGPALLFAATSGTGGGEGSGGCDIPFEPFAFDNG